MALLNTLARAVRGLTLGLWLGAAVMIFITAHYVFKIETNRTLAGDIMAPILHTATVLNVALAFLALAAEGVLRANRFGSYERGTIAGRVGISTLVCATLLALFVALWLEPKLADLRAQIGEFTEANLQSPLRLEFGKFHGVSMGVALLETLLIAAALICAAI